MITGIGVGARESLKDADRTSDCIGNQGFQKLMKLASEVPGEVDIRIPDAGCAESRCLNSATTHAGANEDGNWAQKRLSLSGLPVRSW